MASTIASASLIFTTPANSSGANGPLSGSVEFTVFNCVVNPTVQCDLNIAITNSQTNITSIGQAISDVSFTLLNGQNALTTAGSLSNTITDGSGGAVTVVTFPGGTTTTTNTKPANWTLIYDNGLSAFHLDALAGGQPDNLIISPGPWPNVNGSFTAHDPSLASTVVFLETGILGLTDNTTFGSVNLSFGTMTGETVISLCGDCGGGGTQQDLPEPVTYVLVGSGLGLFGLLRRRLSA